MWLEDFTGEEIRRIYYEKVENLVCIVSFSVEGRWDEIFVFCRFYGQSNVEDTLVK